MLIPDLMTHAFPSYEFINHNAAFDNEERLLLCPQFNK